MPHLNKLYTQMRSKGLEILAIDLDDPQKTVAEYWKSSGYAMKALLNGSKVAEMYHVEGIPTNYLIDSNGKIIAAFVGFDEDGIRQALTKAGVK